MVTYDLYQGVGVGYHHMKHVAAVGSAGATLLDLVNLLPEEKRNLPYHFFADNFFSSMKLLDVITGTCYNYTGTLQKKIGLKVTPS